MAKKIFTDESLSTFVDEIKSYTDTEVAKKANASHRHSIGEVNGLQDALNGKPAINHTHTSDTILMTQTVANLIDYPDGEPIDCAFVELSSKIDSSLNSAKSYTDTALANYYTKTEIDNMEFITVDDIDAICGTTIQVASASEVTF